MGLKWHCALVLVLCISLIPGVSASGDFDWKPLVITLGAVAAVLLLIINIVFIVRCCKYCQTQDDEKAIYREPTRQQWHISQQYPRQVPFKLRPEVGAALVAPNGRSKSRRETNIDRDSDYLDDDYRRPPSPPPNRGAANDGFINLDFDTGEERHSQPAYPTHTTTSANAYSSIPREPEPYRAPAPAMASPPRAAGFSDSTLNAEIYPDVSVDDYLSGRFQPPANRRQ